MKKTIYSIITNLETKQAIIISLEVFLLIVVIDTVYNGLTFKQVLVFFSIWLIESIIFVFSIYGINKLKSKTKVR